MDIHAETQKFNVGVFFMCDSIDPMTFTTTWEALAAGINPWENNKIGNKYVNSLQCRWSDRDCGPDLHCPHSLYLVFVFLGAKP